MITRGVELVWLEEDTIQVTYAPRWYSLAARMLGGLCGSCDLGLMFSCSCPPSEDIHGGLIIIDPGPYL